MTNIKNIVRFYVTHHPAILGLPADTAGTLHMAHVASDTVFWFDNDNNEWHTSIYPHSVISKDKGYKEVSKFENGYISTEDALRRFVRYYPEFSLSELINAYERNLLEEKISSLSAKIDALEDKLDKAILPRFKVGQKVWWTTRGKPYTGIIKSIEYNESKKFKSLCYHVLVDNTYYETHQEHALFKTKNQAIKNDIRL